jgi:hypothetical protein
MEDRTDVRRRFDPCTTSTSTSMSPLADEAVSPIPVEAVTFGSAAIVLAYVRYHG